MNKQNGIKAVVRDKYNEIARTATSCCGPDGCNVNGDSYKDLQGYVSGADLGLGCGLPTQHADIKTGNTVVDLGSGAGNDAFIARDIVGPQGKVIGIDFATDMIAKAEANRTKLNYSNVEFVHGDLEAIPLPDSTADVVVSNCVMNLVPNKAAAYSETYRILKPGGHFSISDIVMQGDLPESLRVTAELYVGCVSGAIDKEDYLRIIENAGFEDVSIRKEQRINLSTDVLKQFLTDDQIQILTDSGAGVYSVTVNASKPKALACCGSSCCT